MSIIVTVLVVLMCTTGCDAPSEGGCCRTKIPASTPVPNYGSGAGDEEDNTTTPVVQWDDEVPEDNTTTTTPWCCDEEDAAVNSCTGE